MRDRTLCFLIREHPTTEVLLGFKKVRFGAGKYAGFGGRIEPGETQAAAAVRELEEETGIKVLEEDLRRVGQLTFSFPARPAWSQVVHVFLATTWDGQPVESEEMAPAWFPLNGVPYERMWGDAAHWLPQVLAGERIRAHFTFKEDNETVDEVEIKALTRSCPMYLPTFQDVLHARQTIAPYLRPTALHFYQGLSDLTGAEVWVKHENHQPVGAFKVRGGVNLIANLSGAERARGVVTASTGNHGQSIAYGARLFGVRAIIAMPEGANPDKAAAIRNMGAEIHFHGRDFDDARLYAEELAGREGMRFVSSGDEPHLIAGVGTYALEIVERLPDVDAILVPVGGGSGASGVSIVAKTVNPGIQVIGVQAEKAPSAYLSWNEGRRIEARMETFAEGLATRAPFDLPQAILRRHLDDFVLVAESALKEAVVLMLQHTHNLAEGAGAAALAAALKLKGQLGGKKVVLVQSGGNLSLARLREILNACPERQS